MHKSWLEYCCVVQTGSLCLFPIYRSRTVYKHWIFSPSAHRMDSERIVRKYLTKRRLLDYNRLPTFFFSFFLFSFLSQHPSYPYHPSVFFFFLTSSTRGQVSSLPPSWSDDTSSSLLPLRINILSYFKLSQTLPLCLCYSESAFLFATQNPNPDCERREGRAEKGL